MNKEALVFNDIVEQRRSVRIYNEGIEIDEGVVERSLQRAVLAPNSSNLQLWEFYRVKSKDKKEALAEICLDQKAAATAKELVVFVARADKWKERSQFVLNEIMKDFESMDEDRQKMVQKYYGSLIPLLYRKTPLDISGKIKNAMMFFVGMSKPTVREVDNNDVRVVVHKSVALAAQTFMLSIKAEGYDTCPMEGFDSKRAKRLLKLPSAAEITMIVSVGKAKPEGIYGPRIRVDEKEVIFTI